MKTFNLKINTLSLDTAIISDSYLQVDDWHGLQTLEGDEFDCI